MTLPQDIARLIETFDRNLESYRQGRYPEAQVRKEFIDPFFKALGWDMDNERGWAEAYKEVIHEDAIRIDQAVKAPDYCFRIGGTRKFFLEAKKPSVNIKDDPSPAYQLRRYAWSAKLPLSILTDFEEFAVYDCRVRPHKNDKPNKARTMYFTYDEYAQRWDEIASIFSRDAILKGSFDKYAQTKRKRGTAEVDAAFLAEIEAWRDTLARNIALRNAELTNRELNFAVQRTIDRIIFLRICEDRGVERYGQLMGLLNGPGIYQRLVAVFRRADDRYNSGLFHFIHEKDRPEGPDELTPELIIDDKPLKDILRSLYYPDSPYEFSVLPAEILGHVYEQFLGKVITLTAGHRAKVEDKPEVKKAGGVFYTPSYIVDYIVEHTVGKLLADRSVEVTQISRGRGKKRHRAPVMDQPLRVLDPACGSGSFLLGAYHTLLDWYRHYYETHDPETWAKLDVAPICPAADGSWKLTTAERKRILLDHIYGVDIDTQAVEVTKLSLLLRVLEGETNLVLFHDERALPDLASNIKCGNSLIGTDFYEGRQLAMFDDDQRLRINAFDWHAEFPHIFKDGGFDAVIGNPPWISLSGKFGSELHTDEEVSYLIARFDGNTYMPNMYEYFVAQGLNLAAPGGWFSFIVPDRLGYNQQFLRLRKRILLETSIHSLLYKVPFPGITADTLVFAFRRTRPPHTWTVAISEFDRDPICRKQTDLLEHPSHAFEYFENHEMMSLVSVVASCPAKPLGQLCKSTSGFGGKSKLMHESQVDPEEIPAIKGDSIGRYERRKVYWFDFRRENITGRTTDRRKLGAVPKILIRKTGDRIIATFDDSGVFPEQSLYFLFDNHSHLRPKYILGLLNSRLLTAYYRAKSLTNRRSIAQVKKVDLDELPIRVLETSKPLDNARHDQIVSLVDAMLQLHKDLAQAKTPDAKNALQRQIDATDRQIDHLVYELYGLTDDEIKIVEEATP